MRCTAPTALVLYGVADVARVRLGPGAPFTGVLAPGATQYFGKAPAQAAAHLPLPSPRRLAPTVCHWMGFQWVGGGGLTPLVSKVEVKG